MPWILVYLGLYLLQGGGGSGVVGLLSNTRAYLWIPVTQSAYRRVSTELFAHLLDLDHSFHLHRKTGEARDGPSAECWLHCRDRLMPLTWLVNTVYLTVHCQDVMCTS